jgi:hypothetical protein
MTLEGGDADSLKSALERENLRRWITRSFVGS